MTDIRRLQDVQLGDEDVMETFRSDFATDNIAYAQNKINTPKLKSYVLNAEWMNALKTKIEALEEPKETQIDQELDDRNIEFQTNVDRLLYVQGYNSSTQYYKNNFVLYNNKIYYCLNDAKGKTPTNTGYWVELGLKGDKGQYGLGVNYRGEWNSSTSYNKYDLVYYNNKLYVAKSNNQNQTPTEFEEYLGNLLYVTENLYLGEVREDDYWFLLINVTPQPIYIFPESYSSLPVNSIYLKQADILQSVSGNIVSCSSATDSSLNKFIINIEALQTGSGIPLPTNVRPISGWDEANIMRTGTNVWDEEWEAGILNSDGTTATATDRIISKNYISVKPLETYCFSWPNQNAGRAAFYDKNHTLLSYFSEFPETYTQENDRRWAVFTVPDGACYFKFCSNSSYGTTYNDDISINYPSSDHDYHHYYGGAIMRTGKNLFEPPISAILYGSDVEGFCFRENIDNEGTSFIGKIEANKTYTIKAYYAEGLNKFRIALFRDYIPYNQSKNYFTKQLINVSLSQDTTYTFNTFDDNSIYNYIVLNVGNSSTEYMSNAQAQLEEGSEATSYEPYTLLPFSWYDEFGTIYGGTLNVKTGLLTVTHKSILLDGSEDEGWHLSRTGTENWFYVSDYIIQPYELLNNDVETKFSNKYPSAIVSTSNTEQGFWISVAGGYVRIRWQLEDTIDNFKASLASEPLRIVYKIATPLVYQYPSTEVKTFFGENNIWTDCGNVDIIYQKRTI